MKHHFCSSSLSKGVRRISALLVFMLFTFVFVFNPIKVKAEAFPIPPVWLPMNPYNAQGLEDNYVLLNDDQKEIVKEIIGAVNIVNLGFGQYVLMNPISGVQNTRQFLRNYGGTFLETFWSQIMGTSRAMTDFVGSTIYKASTYDNLQEYEADTSPGIASGSQKFFQISPELTVAFKNWYRANGGVEDWQIQTKPFTSYFVWSTYYSNISLAPLSYQNYVNNNLESIHIKSNYVSGNLDRKNVLIGLPTKYNLFFNTSSNRVYLVDDYGVQPSSGRHIGVLIGTSDYVTLNQFQVYFTKVSFSSLSGSSYIEYARDIFNSYNNFNKCVIYSESSYSVSMNPSDVIQHVYVGADWSSKEEIFNIDDLNIGSTQSQYIDNISDTGYVDLNTLIGKIADEVVNLRDIVEESVLVKDNDTAIPYTDSLQIAIDKYINQPESGVVIPSNIFGGLTGANGPVSYLWFMTKPLVSYTGDLLGLLTLEGDGTFQFTGLGYIVIGVVTIGIIGGLVTKCLL